MAERKKIRVFFGGYHEGKERGRRAQKKIAIAIEKGEDLARGGSKSAI